jgi:Na+/proline symporter
MLTLQAQTELPPGLQPADWIIIIGFILMSIGIGLYLSKRARGSSEQYFKGGGGMGWLLLGTSMVATTFAADTPLALTGWVVTAGVAQNWYWWSMVPVTMLGVFFFARLWKRANPMTDMEFVYQRYSGKPAHVLRCFKALWLAFPYGCIVMGWVNKAMGVIINYLVPDFPRIPVVDSLMLGLFLSTPLSGDVDQNVHEAVSSGQIDVVEVAYDLDILVQPILWTEFTAGKYNAATGEDGELLQASRHGEVLAQLGLADQIDLDDFSSIPGIPADLTLIEPLLDENDDEVRDENGNVVMVVRADATSADVLHEVYRVCAGVNQYKILFLLFLIVIAYTSISGLWGVMVTDFIQFWIAMIGCIILAVLAVKSVGGMDALLTQMSDIYSNDAARAMVNPMPTAESGGLGFFSRLEFILFVSVFWWTFGFTDGGSYFAQRMLSAKDERNAAMGYLWYAVAHYALRMWPWLLVGFVAAVLYPYQPYAGGALPGKAVAEAGYVKIMLAVLPAGLLGLLTASLLAAYMSTISTQVNLGASYLMNDVYKPFVASKRERKIRERTNNPEFKFDEKHYVRWGIIMTLVMAFAGIVVSLFMDTISDAWFLLAGFNGGIGLVYILRWYWWRINAWTELVCLATLLLLTLILRWGYIGAFGMEPFLPESWINYVFFKEGFLFWDTNFFLVKATKLATIPFSLLISVPLSVGLALLVTFLTSPVEIEKLKGFHRQVQAGGPGWRKIDRLVKAEDPTFKAQTPLNWSNFRNWVLASATVYFWLVGIGKLILGDTLNEGTLNGADSLAIRGENVFFMSLMIGMVLIGVLRLLLRRGMPGLVMIIILAAFLLVVQKTGLNIKGEYPVDQLPALSVLCMERVVGLAMLVVGVGCGWLVASSFSTKKWSETRPQESATA